MGSVVSVNRGSVFTGSNQATVSVSDVASTDVIVLVEATNIVNVGWATSVSGLGATWTLVSGSQGWSVGGTRMWVGTGATSSSGAITGSGGGNSGTGDGRSFTAYVLRGVTTTDISATSSTATGSTTPTAISADAGDVVIGAGYADTAAGAIQSTTPGAGWHVLGATALFSTTRWYASASRVAHATANHTVTANRPGGSSTASVVRLRTTVTESGPFVIDRLFVNDFNTSSSSARTIDFAETVQPGDVVALFIFGAQRDIPTFTVSGLGATWTSRGRSIDGENSGIHSGEVFTGTTSSDGAITVTPSGAFRAAYYALLIRGATETVTTGSVNASSSTSLNGPSQSAQAGQVVVAAVSITGSSFGGHGLTSVNPTQGWFMDGATATAFGTFTAGMRMPYESTGTAHQITSSGSSVDLRITQAVLGSAASSGVEATLTVTTGGSAALGVIAYAEATLTATTGGSATLGVISPGYTATAALTVTSGGTASLAVGPFSASASLTATTGGAATLGGATPPPGVALTVTTDGSATLGVGTDVYAAVSLTVTTGGSAALGVTATATAALSVGTSGSAWLARTWTPDPATGRGAFALTVTDRAGAPVTSLDTSYFTRAIVDRLNDVDGTGSGTAFTVPDEATETHASLRQYRELQVSRGGHHLGTYVLLNPDDTGTASSVSWQAAGLGHYFTKRRIGPAVRPGLLPKQWRAGFREGSIPPAPPKWSRPGTPALVGPALRVEGSTYVQRTVTRLGADTTFAFGSYVLTGTGKDALRAFAQEIEVDTDLTDLVDLEPPTVTIEGHTDSVPYTSHPGGNQWLSEQRANAVRNYLLPLVPEGTTLIAVGYGASRPVASNATSEGRAANRRVDLTYPKTESARGHRQYLQDSLVYTNPSAHIKRNLTFVSWWSLESYKEPNADGSVIWLGRRPVGSTDDDAWTEADWVDIDAETPLNTWTRSEVSITVPADGQAWEIVARLTPPAGTIVYDEGATELWADDALEFIDVDQALIVKGLVEHAQDPAFDKDDLGILTDTPLTGIKRTRVYYWHERATISDCLEELVNVAGGMDLTWQTTPTTRTLVSHYPRAGQVTSASLTAGEDRTVDDYQISLNGAAAATTVIVQADGSGADREEGVAQGVPDDLDLVLEDVWTAEPGTHIGELNNQAARGHRNYGGHVPIVTATLRQEHTDEWLDRVHLGDVITVDLPARIRHVTGPHRVTARSLDPITDRLIVSPTVEV